MSKSDQYHLEEEWKTEKIEDEWNIVTEKSGFFVCVVTMCLPGDHTGNKTAKHICKLHNDSLKAEK